MAYKKTLLDLTQTILSAMESDEVTDIGETAEAFQVAEIIRDTYYFMMAEPVEGWEHLSRLTSVDGMSDGTQPTTLKLPDNLAYVDRITFVYEDDQGNVVQRELEYRTPEEFLELSYQHNTTDANIEEVVTPNGRKLYVYNDRHPDKYTIWDNDHMICDGFDNTEYSTLHEDQFLCFAQVEPDFRMENTFVPDLPARMFPLLLSEARRACFEFLKQQGSPEDSRRSLSMRNRAHKRHKRADTRAKWKGYGR